MEATAARGADRRTVTILFSDITGSTDLQRGLDPEALRAILARYHDAMRALMERHGASVEKFIGDAMMAVFGIPRLHDDDALRAVRAASEIADALAGLNQELESAHGVHIQTRTGIDTGEVMVGDATTPETLVTGMPANVAARLEQAARPGEILIGAETSTPSAGTTRPSSSRRTAGMKRSGTWQPTCCPMGPAPWSPPDAEPSNEGRSSPAAGSPSSTKETSSTIRPTLGSGSPRCSSLPAGARRRPT
jgi:class 3 adenylate cyclase